MQITVKLKNVFGVERIYPICEKAKLFTKLAGSATLTAEKIKYIKELGYKVVVVQQKVEL